MRLPDEPTIYDYLIMSLRPKDLIATFNWDPFLYQAWSRNRGKADSPYIAFLHGNVALGYDHIEKISGPAGMWSRASGNYFEPSKLLYPVLEKNYSNDEYIHSQWEMFRDFLSDKNVKRLTIFGYSAPVTDVEAIKVLKESWFLNQKRDVEDIEVIDIQPKEKIEKHWNAFLPSNYYSIKNDFFSSVIAHQPRRTSESYFLHNFFLTEEEAFAEPNPVPRKFESLQQMWNLYEPLIDAEKKHDEKEKRD